MLDIVFYVVVFVVSLAVLIKSADWFTEFSERFGLSIGIPEFVIGVTLVSIGTSLPELVTSAIAAFQGHAQLAVDNVIGSNISNILLILGLSAVVAGPLIVRRDLIDLDLPLLASSQVLFLFMIFDGVISFFEAVLCLFAAGVFIHYTLRHSCDAEVIERKKENKFRLLLFISGSLVLLIIGAKYTVSSLLSLGDLLGVGASALAATALAVGTSLPELVVSISAARKLKFEMAIGNIIGSNIFNSAGIIGIIGIFSPLVVSATALSVIPFLVAATVLCVISGISKKIYSWEGAFFLVLFALFVGASFGFV